MSVAAATTTILFKRKIGAVSSTIISPRGDLVQFYDGTPTDPGKIYQDFSNSQISYPLYLVASSSRSSENMEFSQDVKVYVNDELLTFQSNRKSTNVFNGETGHFTLYNSPNSPSYCDGITIDRNLVTAFGGNQVVIRMVGKLSDSGGASDDISATYTIPVQKSTGSPYHVTIAAGDSNNFVITSKDDEKTNHCILVAKVYSVNGGGTPVTEGLSYNWYIESEDGWGDRPIGTLESIKITEDNGSSMANIKVEVIKGGITIGTDIQTVRDNTDPMSIDLGAAPKDETIVEGSGGKVTYTPHVLYNDKVQDGYLFRFAASDSSGVPLNTAAGDVTDDPNLAATTEKMASFSVTEAMCVQAEGNVALSIYAVPKETT